MELQDLRREIDKIDDEILQLFVRRMGVAAQIAVYKKENNLPVFAPTREQEKLADITRKAGADMADFACALYETVFELSRTHQSNIIDKSDCEVVQ